MRIALVQALESYKNSLFPVVKALHEVGATAYLVGGCVRDMVLGMPLKDLDIEVHGIDLAQLAKTLSQFGHVEEVGKKFGVLLILGVAIDWSIPRLDSSGRKPDVVLQPALGIKTALRRRDLTMNAMAINLTAVILEGRESIEFDDIVDPYGGLVDIAAKQLRAVDKEFFTQDPLRLLRVMQFIGRFEMTPTQELNDVCARMSLYDEYDQRPLARERIYEEVNKLLYQARDVALGFEWIVHIGRANELFPFLDSEYVHEALDGLRFVQKHVIERNDYSYRVMLASLCWPWFKKNNQSKKVDQVIFSVTAARENIVDLRLILEAMNMSCEFMGTENKLFFIKKLASHLGSSLPVKFLAILVAWEHDPLCMTINDTLFYDFALKAGVLEQAVTPLLQGRDLLKYINPGPEMGELLSKAYLIQLEQNVQNKDELIRILFEK